MAGEEFRIRLREVRKAQGMSLLGLSREAGVTRQQLYNIEHGADPRISTVCKLAVALNTSLDEFVEVV